MFLKFRQQVIEALKEYGDEKFLRESDHADLSSTITFKISKEKNQKPQEVAESILENLELKEYIGSVEALNGYINFFASYEFLEDTINSIIDLDENYGSLSIKGNVLIEHTSANPDGPLHIGHIRNSIIGDTLARIFRKAGYNVTTHYYVNDMGRQMAITVLGVERFGVDSSLKIDHAVAKAYIQMNKFLDENPDFDKEVGKLMIEYEQGDEEVVKRFREVVNMALKGIRETLTKLNVRHDEYVWESEFIRNGYVDRILNELDSKNLIRKDGAWILEIDDFEKEIVLKRENGTTVYITRDVAYHVWKSERFEESINVLGADHKLYGMQLKKLLEILSAKLPKIVFFEFVSLPEGSMSTRRGKFISADELIDKLYREAYKIIEGREIDEEEKKRIAKAVAIAALRYDFVRIAPEKPMTFDWKKALGLENTANYIQYSHARACSILRNAVRQGMPDLEFIGEICSDIERKLVMLLSKFSYYVLRVVKELRPNVFADYIMNVAITFNEFYRTHPVLKAESDYRMHRLAIVDATRIVLRNGLELLGIEALEKM
ncbi:MAG TPA: arginine--tRNA ligase [Archaeoglobus veneficus]|nr:arginine--tRNA ligase [Archaeoglobus veneficus]